MVWKPMNLIETFMRRPVQAQAHTRPTWLPDLFWLFFILCFHEGKSNQSIPWSELVLLWLHAILFFTWGSQGLTKAAAEAKWSLDFNRLPKEQRPANDIDGNAIGLVAQLQLCQESTLHVFIISAALILKLWFGCMGWCVSHPFQSGAAPSSQQHFFLRKITGTIIQSIVVKSKQHSLVHHIISRNSKFDDFCTPWLHAKLRFGSFGSHAMKKRRICHTLTTLSEWLQTSSRRRQQRGSCSKWWRAFRQLGRTKTAYCSPRLFLLLQTCLEQVAVDNNQPPAICFLGVRRQTARDVRAAAAAVQPFQVLHVAAFNLHSPTWQCNAWSTRRAQWRTMDRQRLKFEQSQSQFTFHTLAMTHCHHTS